MSGAAGRKPFDYAAIKEGRRQEWQRRMAGFEGLVFKAWPKVGVNPEPLIAYLRGDGPLSRDYRESLIALIERYDGLIKRMLRPNGRPRGSITPKNEAIRCASYLVRIGKNRWRRKHGRQHVPEDILERLSNRAIELVEPEFPSARGKISTGAVIHESHLKRCEEMGTYEFLDEAKWEIIELAQR